MYLNLWACFYALSQICSWFRYLLFKSLLIFKSCFVSHSFYCVYFLCTSILHTFSILKFVAQLQTQLQALLRNLKYTYNLFILLKVVHIYFMRKLFSSCHSLLWKTKCPNCSHRYLGTVDIESRNYKRISFRFIYNCMSVKFLNIYSSINNY